MPIHCTCTVLALYWRQDGVSLLMLTACLLPLPALPAGLQVTKEATTHLAFHPTTDTLIVACAGEPAGMDSNT